ncbi:MAG: ChbG/HpnK family deacetylase [Kofleriaceae bacterium]|nr:ChbG/HpnK family deacetylase [Kofleriaceae bacterium]MCL4226877.1 ChbG/HpnK family deacetylase [Myxococcales bacterium]
MRTLIVNADDFGLSASVNAGIVHAHVAGIVTSTTLLANGAAFVEAVALARRHPTLGVGVHLDLVEGRPLSAPATVGSLVDPDGAFVGSTPALAARAVRGRLAYPELVAEASAQLARVVDAGLRPTHVDTHQHAHCLPIVCAAVLEAAARFGIRRIRFPRERNLDLPGRHTRSRVRSALTGLLATHGRGSLARHAARTTDAFIGPQLMGAFEPETLARVVDALPPGATELMCHPGLESEPGALIQRGRELAALTAPLVRRVLALAGVTLASFAAL